MIAGMQVSVSEVTGKNKSVLIFRRFSPVFVPEPVILVAYIAAKTNIGLPAL